MKVFLHLVIMCFLYQTMIAQDILKETIISDPNNYAISPLMLYNTNDNGYILEAERGKVPENVIIKINKNFDTLWNYSFRTNQIAGNTYFIINPRIFEMNSNYIHSAFWAGSKSLDWGYFNSFTLSESGKLISNNLKNDTNELYYGTTDFISVDDSNYLAYGMDAYFNNKSIFLKKIDKLGNKIWIKYYKDSADSELIPIKLLFDSNNNPTIFSNRINPNETRKLCMLRCDINGNEVHRKIIDISFNTMTDIVQVEDGNYLLLSAKSDSINNYYTCIVKIDKDGNTLWEKKYSFADFTVGWSISYLSNKYYIAGYVANWDKFKATQDTATVKSVLYATDLQGNISWKKVWELKNMNYLRKTIINSKNNIVVAGYNNQKIFISEIVDNTTGIIDNPKVKEDIVISPNPASDFITVTLKPSEGSEINIYNTLGEKVMSVSIHPMTSSHRMNIESLPKGMYFVRFGDKVSKFIKI